MKSIKAKPWLVAALVAGAGILGANAGETVVASGEKEFALLPPVTLTGLSATAIALGQSLAASTITGTATAADFGTVAGTFAWADPTPVPTLSDSGTTYDVIFTPSNENHSKAASTTLALTVQKSASQQAIETAFDVAHTGSTVEPVYGADNVLLGYSVTLGGDCGPLTLPGDCGAVAIDLNGWSIRGTTGGTGSGTAAGGNGIPAITIAGTSGAGGARRRSRWSAGRSLRASRRMRRASTRRRRTPRRTARRRSSPATTASWISRPAR